MGSETELPLGSGESSYGSSSENHPDHEAVVVVSDPLGLHLRTGKDVVRVASQFRSEILAHNLSRESAAVDVKSILQLMQLQARHGHEILLVASGDDAAAALDALRTLF